jgi:nitrate reductase gamma subunit
MGLFDKILVGLLFAAASWAAISLLFIWVRTKAFGRRTLYAKAAGGAIVGSAYAFTIAMLPWEKESVRENLTWYAWGIAYHLGIFFSFSMQARYLATVCFPSFFGGPLAFVNHFAIDISFAALTFIGAIGGLLLLIKRATEPIMRGISCPDDYISNLLATIFVALSLAFLLLRGFLTTRLCMASAIVLLAYLPLGKIRHCFFFFISRYHFGAFFGRRGCMPPSK